jgi:hypothetical protein
MASSRASFRRAIEQWLTRRPRRTGDGVVGQDFRSAQFGSRAGGHEALQCWVYRRDGHGLEMLFAFYENFTAYDLICKVLAAGHSVRPDDGASIQFNADRCVRAVGRQTWALTHHGRVTAGETISKARLLHTVAAVAPTVDAKLGDLRRPAAWPLQLGRTSDPASLVDRLFLYAYCVEQAKRSIRGEKALPSL